MHIMRKPTAKVTGKPVHPLSDSPSPSEIEELLKDKEAEDVECPSKSCACRKPLEWIDYSQLPSEVSATASDYIGCPVLICPVQDVKIELAYFNALSFVGKIMARKGLRYFFALTFAPFRCVVSASSQAAIHQNKIILGNKQVEKSKSKAS